MLPEMRLASDSGVYHAPAIASIAAMSTIYRPMTPRNVNNFDLPRKRTSTALPVLTLAERWTGMNAGGYAGPMSIERAVGICNAAGQSYYHNTYAHADEEYQAFEAAYIAEQLAAGKTVYAEVLNEASWNGGFSRSYNDGRLEGLRRGYAPSTPGEPETVIDAGSLISQSSGITNTAFAAGDKLYSNIYAAGHPSGMMVWDCIADAPIGADVWNEAYFSLRYDNVATARAGQRCWGMWTVEMKDIISPEITSRGRERPYICLSMRAGQTGISEIQPMLDFANVGDSVDYLMGGWYFGGGIDGYNAGPFTNASLDSAGWDEAAKTLAYAGDIAGALNAFFPAVYVMIDALIARAVNTKLAVAAYNVTRGWSPDRIQIGAYEGGHHIEWSGYPDQAYIWSARIGAVGSFAPGSFAVGSDGQTYQCLVTNSGDPVGSANWEVYTDPHSNVWTKAFTDAQRAATRPSIALYRAIMLDERMGQALAYMLEQWQLRVGGPFVFYTRVKQLGATPSSPNDGVDILRGFGVQETEEDADVSGGADTNWRMKALADFQAGLVG